MKVSPAIIRLHDLYFEQYITSEQIEKAVRHIAEQINKDYAGKEPLFLVILNGAFMFASDLLKQIHLNCTVLFYRLSSYHGTDTTNEVKELLGIEESLEGRDVIIVEDIVDTGITLEYIIEKVQAHQPCSLKIATLLFKKEKYTKQYSIDYFGFSIPPDFVVGYGLDYDGLGRNLKDLYKLKTDYL